jgi:hypothetical protein
MKLCAHSVVIVTRHRANERPILPIPYPYRLVVGTRYNPGQLVVEEHGSNIVEMSIQREETPPCLIRPYFDFVIISTGNKQSHSWIVEEWRETSIHGLRNVSGRRLQD